MSSYPLLRKGLKSLTTKCHYCNAIATTIDHAIPKARGGASIARNLRPCCAPCNWDKGTLTEREYFGLDEPILCYCSQAFNTVKALNRHQSHHGCKKGIRCFCKRVFFTQRGLTDHLKVMRCVDRRKLMALKPSLAMFCETDEFGTGRKVFVYCGVYHTFDEAWMFRPTQGNWYLQPFFAGWKHANAF